MMNYFIGYIIFALMSSFAKFIKDIFFFFEKEISIFTYYYRDIIILSYVKTCEKHFKAKRKLFYPVN